MATANKIYFVQWTSFSMNFHEFPWQMVNFHEFPGLENEIVKLHDFPGFPWPVQTLVYVQNNHFLLKRTYCGAIEFSTLL